MEQSAFSVADGAKRAKPNQQIRRPDFIAMMDGFGTVAIDVKDYKFQSSSVKVDLTFEDGQEGFLDLSIYWVKLAWDDICKLFELQRVSNIPTWLCVVNTDSWIDYYHSAWFRVDRLYESFSKVFSVEDTGFYYRDNQIGIQYFDGWPEITLEVDSSTRDSRLTFQVLVEFPDHVDVAGLTESGTKIYVPPIIINLKEHSSLCDLINIWPAQEISSEAATSRQMSYATDIARILELPLPLSHDKSTISNFIFVNKKAFDNLRTR